MLSQPNVPVGRILPTSLSLVASAVDQQACGSLCSVVTGAILGRCWLQEERVLLFDLEPTDPRWGGAQGTTEDCREKEV